MKTKTPYAKHLLIPLLGFFAIIFFAGSSSLNAQILVNSSFEGSNPFAGFTTGQACCSYSVTSSTAQSHDGTQSFRAEVKKGDPAVSSGYRAELRVNNLDDDGDMWYGYSTLFEKVGGDGGHCIQWHPNNGTGSATLSIWTGESTFNVVRTLGGGANYYQSSGGAWPVKPIILNKWYDIVFHVKWSTGSDGIIEIWLDGQKYYDYRGQTMPQEGVYIKFGMNRWNVQNDWVIFYDNLKIGRNVTYNDVAPASTTAPANQPPVARAGNDINIGLPTVLTTLDGSASSDPDGTIASYSWTRVSGPTTFSLLNPLSALTTLTSLVQGTYVFRLTVTDNKGATATDDVTVNVAGLLNQSPSANAGNDITLTLPTNSTTLSGGGTDPDGSIASYAWTRVSGPTTFSIASASSATTALTNLVQGTYVFRLTVTDNNGATSTDNVSVVVNAAPNQAPSANAGNDITLTLPTNSTTLNGSGLDSDGSVASYAWTRVSGPTTFTLANAGAASTAVSNLVQGVYVFRLTVTDNKGSTASDNITVTVNAAPNQGPTANAGNDITITLPTNSTTLTGSGTDTDGTISSYAWTRVSGPTTFTLANASAASTALTNLVQGVYVFRLTVSDNSGSTATDNITVTVNAAPNQGPTANAGNDITITLPTNSTTLNGTGTDPDGSISSYAWNRVSGPTTYVLATASAASTSLTNLVQGVYVFRLTVRDNSGATATDNITVTVNAAPNQAPTANAGNDITITLPINYTTLTGSGTDADGNISSYAWSRVSGPATFTLANANSASTALTNLVEGVYVFRLTVYDNQGASATDTRTVTVNPAPNQAPAADAGNAITITLPVNSTTLNGTGTDTDGTISSYAWTRVSGPTTFTLANASAASTSLTNLVEGVYVFRLTVTDNDGATSTDNVTVTVLHAATPVNQLPVAAAGNDIVLTLPNNSTSLNGAGSTDSDGTISTYSWTRISGPTTFTLGNATAASTTLTNLVQGVYVFRLTVTDNSGGSSTDNVTITVNAAPPPPNQGPTANAGNDMTITLPTNSVTMSGTGTDPDGSIVSYAWSRVSGPTTFTVANAAAASSAITNLVQGVYVFRLTVTDNSGATATDNVTVTVNAAPVQANRPPVARAGNDEVRTLPVTGLRLNGIASTDPDGQIVSYEWRQLTGPSQAVITDRLATASDVSGLAMGEYVCELKVTDDDGAVARDTVKILVKTADGKNAYCNLFPVPATDKVTLQYYEPVTGPVKIVIYDARRVVVREERINKDVVAYTQEIDISRLRPGFYFLQIVKPDRRQIVLKFIKR